MFRCKRW